MNEFTSRDGNGLLWKKNNESIWIVPWGKNGARVRVTKQASFKDTPGGLLTPPPPGGKVKITIGEQESTLVNGELTVKLSAGAQLTFIRNSDGKPLLTERARTTAEYHGRTFTPRNGTWHIDQRFFAREGERFYGMGQRQHGFLDQKGCVLDLMHRNTEVSIPFLISSEGYGFLWNHPGVGRVDLGRNDTRWIAESAQQIDYYIVIDKTPAALLTRYAEVTGFPSEFPEWASGFWQCKLRYKTQNELMDVAREYKRRKLPISVIIIDFHHWRQMGDWTFDPECWPDPAAMVKELKEMGIELMVSVWPTVNVSCKNYPPMKAHGLLIRNERGFSIQNNSTDNHGSVIQTFYDSTNPEARTYLWKQIMEGYVKYGIKLFWLDTMEPELCPLEQDNTRYHLGNGLEVSGLYPLHHAQAFHDGLKSTGETAILTLGRSAWIGSQRFGAAVWSADIPSTFDSLQRQVAGGLNIAMSGIPWWTTDIGGFYGGDIEDPSFRELMVRWFQYGVFCPILRVHGIRRHKNAREKPGDPIANPNHPNVANEVWSYGEEVYGILRDQLFLRERLRPYIRKQMKVAQKTGLPPMRPLFVDFPEDQKAWQVEDQFLFGPDLVVAPVVAEGVRTRPVYLPSGTAWRCAWTGKVHKGGTIFKAEAPLARIPVFIRQGSKLQLQSV